MNTIKENVKVSVISTGVLLNLVNIIEDGIQNVKVYRVGGPALSPSDTFSHAACLLEYAGKM